MRKGGWIALGIAALLAGGAGAWWHWRPLPLAMERARTGEAADLVYATGYVEAQQPVSIGARITAPVARVLVEEGARVTRGQALVVLAADEQQALVDQARAQQQAAEVVERRNLALFREGWVTGAARDSAVTTADAARAASATARARLDQLVVRANTDGIVTRRDVYPGDLAVPGKVLIQLGDPARTRITATVDERDIARVAVGQSAFMSSDAWPGRVMHAHVAEVTPGGDPTTRAFRVRLLPDDAPDLPMGLTLEINIVTRQKRGAVLVSASAVAGTRDRPQVWVVADGRASPRAITRGTSGPQAVEVTSGLKPGEMVITSPPASLSPGTRVKAAP